MKNLNELVGHLVELEVAFEEGSRAEDWMEIDARLYELGKALDDLGKVVGLEVFFIRRKAREDARKRRNAA